MARSFETSMSHKGAKPFPTIDWESAQRFLMILKGADPICWQILSDQKEKGKAEIVHGPLDEVKAQLIQAQQSGCGIFVTVNRTDGQGRKSENVLEATAVFVDGDGIPLPETWALSPHIIVQRDEHHWHAYWLIEPTEDLSTWTTTQKYLAQCLGTDSKISDPPRVMRVPGFWHQKGEPVLVELVKAPDLETVAANTIHRYALSEIQNAYPGSVRLRGPSKPPSSVPQVEQTPEVKWDLPESVEAAVEYVRHEAPLAVQGQHGDNQTVQVAACLKDLGISQTKAVELLKEHWNPRCQPPWPPNELAYKVRNAYAYLHQKPPGRDSPASARAQRLRRVLGKWVWLVEAECFIRRRDCKMWNTKQFESFYSHLVEKGTVYKLIVKSDSLMRKFETVTYQPGKPEFTEDGAYNIWRKSGIEPQDGDVPWFLNHMIYLIPDEGERGQVLDYLAYLAQNPGQKIHFALVLQGQPGTGKSFIGLLMEQIIGTGNTSRPSNQELHSEWTTWQRQAQLVVVEELMAFGRQELVNKLKPVITDETIRINEKYLNTYSLNNCLNFLMFTNHKDALKIELNDRRFFVVFSPAKPAIESYYAELFAHLKGDGPAHVAHWLLQRDLSNFRPKGQAPWTTAKQEMRNSTMDEVHQYLTELHETGTAPFHFDLIHMDELEFKLPERLSRIKNLNGKLTAFLRDHLGASKLTKIPIEKGKKLANLWVWQNYEKWASMKKPDVGNQYDTRPRS